MNWKGYCDDPSPDEEGFQIPRKSSQIIPMMDAQDGNYHGNYPPSSQLMDQPAGAPVPDNFQENQINQQQLRHGDDNRLFQSGSGSGGGDVPKKKSKHNVCDTSFSLLTTLLIGSGPGIYQLLRMPGEPHNTRL